MLRIFGFYNFNRASKDIIFRMRKNFEIKSKFTKFISFDQGNIFLDYEMVNSKESENFYFIDKDRQIACFITGNIYAYENNRLELLQGKNIAKMIAARFKKGDLFDSLKYFRGEFNIIIVDKKQLFLINDTLGLSPMYTYRSKEGILFSNQAEPIIWMDEDNHIDYSSIAELLVYGFVPNGKTFIRGLNNQPPGTAIGVDKSRVSVNKYARFKRMKGKEAIQRQKIKIANEVFNEAVRIRANKGRVFSDLTGGWDTRFVLANLVGSNKNITLFTEDLFKEDVVISKEIAEKFNLEHIMWNPSMVGTEKQENYGFKFKLRQTIPDDSPDNISNKSLSYLTRVKFFTSPRFTGLFGTSLMGRLPDWFRRKITQEFIPVSTKTFTTHFLSKLHSSPYRKPFPGFKINSNLSEWVYLFLTQIGRSYLSVLYDSWKRPAYFFSYLFLHPFADSKLISLLCSLDYDKDMYYRLYTKIYKRYYPEYLNIPWTDEKYRIKSNFKRPVPAKGPSNIYKLSINDEKFKEFLKTNLVVYKTKDNIFSGLKELYLIFKWLEVYGPVLHESEIESLIGK